jgi:hypothetical protein
MTATTSTAIAVAERLFTGQEELALAGFSRGSLDRHATYVVAAYVAGAAR